MGGFLSRLSLRRSPPARKTPPACPAARLSRRPPAPPSPPVPARRGGGVPAANPPATAGGRIRAPARPARPRLATIPAATRSKLAPPPHGKPAPALPGTGVTETAFWSGFAALLADLAPKNRALLARRDDLQAQIDAWHIARRGQPHDHAAYKAFLAEIGYLLPEGPDFQIDTANVDPEIARVPGPAAGGAGHQRPLCAERRQCPLGQPVRLPLRHRRDGVGPAAKAAMTAAAARAWWPAPGCSWTRPSRSRAHSHADVRRYHVKDGALLVDDLPLVTRRNSSATAATRRRPDAVCCATTACMSNWSSTGRISSAPATRPARRRAAGKRDVGDHGLRGFGRLRRCRGQGAGL
jgi:hypothetical protein